MKVFDIVTKYTYGQTHSVVAKSIAAAAELYEKHYPYIEIKEIRLHANYVIVQEEE